MGFIEVIGVSSADLDVCDLCNQQGRIASGHTDYDNHGERLLFTCFNCLQKDKR